MPGLDGGQPLATPPIRGRSNELKEIGALVSAAAQGRRGVLVIEGPAGIGKSRLLTETLAMADGLACGPCSARLSSTSSRCRSSRCSRRRCALIRRSGTSRRCAGLGNSADLQLLGGARSAGRDSCRGGADPAGDPLGGHSLGRHRARCWRCGRLPPRGRTRRLLLGADRPHRGRRVGCAGDLGGAASHRVPPS